MASGATAPGAIVASGASSGRGGDPTTFESVLFEGGAGSSGPAAAAPEYFGDLHLSDIVAAIVAGREGYDLAGYFAVPLSDVDAIGYRHEVFRDLEDRQLATTIASFAEQMRTVRGRLRRASKVYYRYEQERWLVDAADAYVGAIRDLATHLADLQVRSRGLVGFRAYLDDYLRSDALGTLAADIERVTAALAGVRYRLRLDGSKIVVTPFEPEPDYGAEVLAHFEKFRQGAEKTYEFSFERWPDMNHVEAAILEGVAAQHPDAFGALDAFKERHASFIDATVARFDREIQFYLAYLEYVTRIRRAGLPFCYPDVSTGSRTLDAHQVYDLALAGMIADRGPVVTNDVRLTGTERVIVVSGPNQGGKTTFARTVGQLHHLARVGVLVPAADARVPLVDRIFSHFEHQELVEDLSSKLEDDLRRIRLILAEATDQSLIVMNESFSSTTLDDQRFIGLRIVRRILDLGPLAVIVTFLDELASADPRIVSMTSVADADHPARRTFEIIRRPADGLAYALAIAEKHRLTYPLLKARLSG